MAVNDLFTLYAVDVDTTGTANDVFIDQVSEFDFDLGITEALLGGDGSVFNNFVTVDNQRPRPAIKRYRPQVGKARPCSLLRSPDDHDRQLNQII